ncbi:PAS domain-containing protein [Streptomyces sp. 8N706]|uniref:PAS domain-containing protein n=1 Tax=Streptomyces sp. 8N706 TaxID=3457416 RepID=UPI003FD25BA5
MSSRPSRGAARLAAILDALPDALLLVNCNGTVVNANTIALETFEAPGTALVGRGLLDLLPSFDSKRIPGSMRRREDDEEGGRTKPTRMVARRTDGTEFPVEVTSANLEDGRTPYDDPYEHHYTGDELLMLVVRDLTGTVDTEAELARQQRQTEMILRAAAEGVVGVDTDGKVVLVNPSAAQILGYRASDLGGQELHPLIHHSRPDGTPLPYEESPLADSLRSGRKHRVRGQVLWAKDGRAVPVDLTTAPVRDGDQLVGAVMTFTDRRQYDALASRHAQLLAVLGESLRGPLEQLRGELGTLASDPAGQLWPEANQILHYLTAGYARMTTLVDNVLSYQRLDEGSERLRREEVSLDAVVAAGVEGAIELIGPGRAQFAVHAPPIEAEVDPERLAQALAHLIADVAGVDATGNAPAAGGSGDSTIVVAAAQRGEVVRIEVRGPYAGGDPVHEPIVRGIVRRHGGVLQTHEVPGTGGGSAYVLEVPIVAGGSPGGERQTTERDRENATTVMPVPKEHARGTVGLQGAPDGSSPGGAEGVAGRRDATGRGSTAGGAGGGTGAGAPAGGRRAVAEDVPAREDASQAPTGRRRARRSAEEELHDSNGAGVHGSRPSAVPETAAGPESADTGGMIGPAGVIGPDAAGGATAAPGPRGDGAAPEQARPALPSAAVPGAGTQPGEPSWGDAGQPVDDPAPAAAQADTGARPTGRRRGRPSPAEAAPGEGPQEAPVEGQEGAVPSPGSRSGRRARHGGTDQSYGSLATAAEGWDSDEDDDFGPQSTPYASGLNGAAVPPQGIGGRVRPAPMPAESADNGGAAGGQTGRALPALPGAPSDDGRRDSWVAPGGTGQGPGPAAAQLPPSDHGPAAQDGDDNVTGPRNAPYGRPAANGATVPPQGTGGRRAQPGPMPTDTTPAAPTANAGARPALPAANSQAPGPVPPDAMPTMHPGEPQAYGQGPAVPRQAQPPGQQTGRRARRALADAADRSVPGQDRTGAEPGADRRPFALPPAAADQVRPPSAGPAQPGDRSADEHGRHEPASPDAEHTPPRAHPLPPTGRRRARRDPAEEQQLQTGGGPVEGPPAHGTPSQGPSAPAAPAQPTGAPADRTAEAGRGAPWGEDGQASPGVMQNAGYPQAVPPSRSPEPQPQPQPQPYGRQGSPNGGQQAAPRRIQSAQPLPAEAQGGDSTTQSRAISVRTLGQGVPFAQQITEQQRPQQPASGQTSGGSGRRRKLAAPPQEDERGAPSEEPTARTREGQQQPPRLLDTNGGRAYAIGAPDEGAEGPEPLDGPNGAIDVTDSQAAPPMDDELPPEPLDNPRRLLVWPAPDVSTQQALSDRGYRPVIVNSREEVDAQIAAYPAALFVDPLTGPITRTALQSLRTAAVAAEVPVLVTAGLGQATREAAYGADPAVLLKALAPRDSEQHPSRVLLIETHDAIAGALTATLERRGMQVARAASDADAVTLATQMRPNLVVMDLMQVRRRRAGIVDWLRANGLLNRTPLVVYTSADIDPEELPRLSSGETVLFLAERSTSAEVQGRIVDLLSKIGTN